jgi:transposase-like protein
MLHSIYDQPDADAVHTQFDRVVDALAEKLPAVAEHLERRQIGSTNPTNASIGRSVGAPTWSGSSPTGPASFRLVGAVLAEQHDEWAEGRRYLGLDVIARAQAVATSTEEVTDEPSIQALTA